MITQSVPIYSLLTGQLVDYSADPDTYINEHDRCYYFQHDTEETLTELFFEEVA